MLTFEEKENTILCCFSNELTTEVCSVIETELDGQIGAFLDEHDHPQIVFDMTEVRYISSAFLRLCLVYAKKVKSPSFSVTHCSDDLLKIFQIAGFSDIMNVS